WLLSFDSYVAPRDLHSFPTRRSSDLAAPVGLRALRRSAFMVEAPPGAAAPMIDDIDEAFYIKPDAGKLLCSPSDETPQPPGDARSEEHTSELQSLRHLVCRLLLEKKK